MASCKPVTLAFKVFEASQDVERKNPIILLHGLGGCKEHWDDIPQKVAEATHRRVYAVDARNHGDSEMSDEFNFDLNAVDLIHFIEQIAAEKVTIVGHSMGGITSMKTALKIAPKVDKIIIEDVGVLVHKNILRFISMVFSLHEQALLNMPKVSTKQEATKFLSDFVYERIPDAIKSLVKNSEDKNSKYLKQNSDGSFSYSSNLKVLRKALENVDTLVSKYEGVFDGPSYFIYGKKSMFNLNREAKLIKKHFPKAQLVGIDGATHDVHSDAPHPFVDALLKFLKE
nr:protein ABHD11-like isoform X1 [Parasteatoda tepidariorum]